jgi:predicted dehydrogenase
MSAPTLGVALLGLDHWYTAFAALDSLDASTVARLVGIADADEARQAAMRTRCPDAEITGDPAALLANPAVALALICASTDRAPALARQALAAGQHVVCVKPAARTLSELDGVLAAAGEAGKFFGSFEGMQRLQPRAVLAHDLIQGGAIGTPLSFHQRGHGGLPAPWPGVYGDPESGGSWWLDPARVPGGAWIDHALYAMDFARYVFGPGELSVVGSLIERRTRPDLAVEDYGIALLRLAPAAPGPPVSLVFEDTWAAQPGGGASRTEFLGTHGVLRLDGGDWVVARDGAETRHPIAPGPFFDFDALAIALTSGPPPPFGPADARANLAACLAVYAGSG